MSGARLVSRAMVHSAGMSSLAIAGVSVILVALLSYYDWDRYGRVSEQLDNTWRIALAATDLLSALKDAETGQRGFLLTGRESYLDPYRHAEAAVPQLLGSMTGLTAGRPRQAALVEAL